MTDEQKKKMHEIVDNIVEYLRKHPDIVTGHFKGQEFVLEEPVEDRKSENQLFIDPITGKHFIGRNSDIRKCISDLEEKL